MCTTLKYFKSESCWFMEEDQEGVNAYGCCASVVNQAVCTKSKEFAMDDVGGYRVTIAPVEDLSCRSACCCYYCGLNCSPANKPCGLTGETSALCCRRTGGCVLQTGESKRRGCSMATNVINLLICEENNVNEGPKECIILEDSFSGNCLCCFEYGQGDKMSCCPSPIVLCGGSGQSCCVFSRSGIPCNDFTPCEIGCCGIFCMEQKERIMAAEAAEREARLKMAESGTIEATIVAGGGAPAEKMDR